MNWNRISLLFSEKVTGISPENRRGQYAVTLFLDWVLPDCTEEVRQVLAEAIREAEVRKEEVKDK